jgi:hypothetical protein
MWSKSSPPSLQAREYEIIRTDLPGFWFRYEFLPGGRWLLGFGIGAAGAAFLLDVETSNPKLRPTILFDYRLTPITDRSECKFKYSHWIDRSKPRLSFLLASTFASPRTLHFAMDSQSMPVLTFRNRDFNDMDISS